MKYYSVCLLSLVLIGCAAKKQPAPKIPTIPVKPGCIVGGVVDKAKCTPLPSDKNRHLADCNHVVIEYRCIEFKPE